MPTKKDNVSSSPKSIQNNEISLEKQQQKFRFVYKNQEYDISDYVVNHPGGYEFIKKMSEEKKDITEYFRMLHSKKALKILKSMPKIDNKQQPIQESQSSKEFTEIKNQVKHLFQPNMFIEVLLLVISIGLLLTGALTSSWILGIIFLAATQNICGWIGHSQMHSRDPTLRKITYIFSPILTGLSPSWWNRKHNLHHTFTNHRFDEDYQHSYNRLLFVLLFFKWKYDSLLAGFGKLEFIYLLIHHFIVFQQNIFVICVAWIISGFFTAVVLVGNHEKEHIFEGKIDVPFFKHMILASRDYPNESFVSMIFMGGMQYQTEHHFFPQIPFYYLPKASKIIRPAIEKLGLKIHIEKIPF